MTSHSKVAMHSLQVEVLPSGLLQENPRVLSQPFWLLLRFLKSFFFFQRYHFSQPSTLTINETRTIFFLKSTIALDSPLIITPKYSPTKFYLSFCSFFPSRLSHFPSFTNFSFCGIIEIIVTNQGQYRQKMKWKQTASSW